MFIKIPGSNVYLNANRIREVRIEKTANGYGVKVMLGNEMKTIPAPTMQVAEKIVNMITWGKVIDVDFVLQSQKLAQSQKAQKQNK